MMDVRPHLLRDERGTTLIEVIVAAVLLVIISGSVTSMIVSAQTGSGQQRVQAVAADLAQSTLEDLRSRKFTNLMNLDATTQVTAGGIAYSVRSQSEWAMQGATGATGCDSDSSSPAALKLSTTVTCLRSAAFDAPTAPRSGNTDAPRASRVVFTRDVIDLGIQFVSGCEGIVLI